MLAASIAKIVAIYAGDHHVVESQRGYRVGQIQWFVGIQWVGPTVAHIAEGAATRAFVPHDHEGGGAFTETLANIGA